MNDYPRHFLCRIYSEFSEGQNVCSDKDFFLCLGIAIHLMKLTGQGLQFAKKEMEISAETGF